MADPEALRWLKNWRRQIGFGSTRRCRRCWGRSTWGQHMSMYYERKELLREGGGAAGAGSSRPKRHAGRRWTLTDAR